MSFLGIDIGTSGSRVAAYDGRGIELAARSRKVTLHRPEHGRVELDADEVFDGIVALIREVTGTDAVRADPVHALSFAVLGEAIVPIDDDGHPLGRAPVSMDMRGEQVAEQLSATFGAARAQRITGQPLHPMFSIYKVLDLIARAGGALRGVPTMDEFVARRLGADRVVDFTMAARTGAFDVDRARWSEEIFTALGVSPALFSPAAPAGTVAGKVSAAAADLTGLSAGTPIVVGAHDQAAAFLGGGGRVDRCSVFSFGSSDCLTVGTTTRPGGLAGSGFATYLVGDGLWITLAGTAAGGWALEWFADFVAANEPDPWGSLFDVADVAPPPLVVLPYFAGSGTLDNDPDALGAVVGLTLETTTAQLARAFLEASGFELAKIRQALGERGIPPTEVHAVGAGSAHPAALRARANAAGIRLRAVTQQASSRGAAMLAAVGVGALPGLADLPVPPTLHEVSPDPVHHAWYERQRETFSRLYPALVPINETLKENA